jgi:hypothetical protein
MTRTSKAITLRLDPVQFRRLAAIARAENRSPTNYVETLVLRDLDIKDEARRVISMFAAPEMAELDPGPLERSADESDERYKQRKALFDELLAIPDEGTGNMP